MEDALTGLRGGTDLETVVMSCEMGIFQRKMIYLLRETNQGRLKGDLLSESIGLRCTDSH